MKHSRLILCDAAWHVKDALKTEEFGVLAEIDVGKTMRETLGIEMEPSVILGACDPPLATLYP